MTFMSWIRGKGCRRATPRADRAMALTSDVIARSRSLRQQLQPFLKENDPFASIVKDRKLADDYTSSQVDRIYLGPDSK